jgi:hypothetical protein
MLVKFKNGLSYLQSTKLVLKIFYDDNQSPKRGRGGGPRLLIGKKPEGKKSRDTVSLNRK